MATTNDAKEGNYIWSDDEMVLFCEILIASFVKNGRGQGVKWSLVQKQLENELSRKCPVKSLKNKYDSMKRDWRLWKFLKTGETG